MTPMLDLALSLYGLKEIPGEEDNPQIVAFFSEIGFDRIRDDETAWCSAFINWLAHICSLERSGALNARSWLKVGVKTTTPTLGDIVIFWRESSDSWKGHVGLFIRDDGEFIYCLGGNQNNQIKISAYPKYKVLGYRRLRKEKNDVSKNLNSNSEKQIFPLGADPFSCFKPINYMGPMAKAEKRNN